MTTQSHPNNTFFSTLESHPYTTDHEYQSGLAAILNTTPPPPPTTSSTHDHLSPSSSNISAADLPSISATPENADLHLRARCFYFSRKHPELTGPAGVDFVAYTAWRSQQPPHTLTPLVLTNPPAPPGSAAVSAENTPEKREVLTNGEGTPTRPSRNGNSERMGEAWLPDATTSDGVASGPTVSFQEVMELIKEGKPIPGIRDIPDTVLDGQGTAATSTQRRKPWETAESGRDGGMPSWQGGRGASLREMFPRRQETA